MALPEGFLYARDAITADEERALLEEVARLPLAPAIYRGFVAKRRVLPFESVPEFLLGLRDKAGALAGVDPAAFVKALVTEYPPGAELGWHRDAPMFGAAIAGFSLASPCRMRLRRVCAQREAFERASIDLEPRSAYVMSGPARSEWQHSIAAVDALRYSITFRTLRTPGRRRSGVY
jgi:alkylated DNA repair dioxygenase AlkB